LRFDDTQAGGESEIGNLDEILGVDEEVTWFNIMMNLTLGMEVMQSLFPQVVKQHISKHYQVPNTTIFSYLVLVRLPQLSSPSLLVTHPEYIVCNLGEKLLIT